MAYWQVKTRAYTEVEWGRCEVQAVLSSMFSADIYLVKGDEPELLELQQRHPTVIVDRARDGSYVDRQSGFSMRLSEQGTCLEWDREA